MLSEVQADIAEMHERLDALNISRGPIGGGGREDRGSEPGASDLQAVVQSSQHLGKVMDHFVELMNYFVFERIVET